MRDTLTESIIEIQASYAGLMDRIGEAIGGFAITPQGAVVLLCLGSQSITPKEITRRRYFVGTNVSYTLRMLETAGLISIITALDKRKKIVTVTETGHSLAAKIRSHLLSASARWATAERYVA